MRTIIRIFSAFSLMALLAVPSFAAPRARLAGGPIPMHTTHNEMSVWLMVRNTVVLDLHFSGPEIDVWRQRKIYSEEMVDGFAPLSFKFEGLQADTEYQIECWLDGRRWKEDFSLRTLKKPGVEDFAFQTGSCMFWTPGSSAFPRIGSPRIFDVMAADKGDFMVWTGDNIYYNPGDWGTYESMMRRQARSRTIPPLNRFMRKMPQYGIWDDHDFGPNDCYGDWGHRDWSLEIIKKFWGNPYYGTEKHPGHFSDFTYQDVQFFLLDDRYYRTRESRKDGGVMFGKSQMDWLKAKLKASDATFKFIAGGSQLANKKGRGEGWNLYKTEQKEFLDWLKAEKIEGVVFLSGDKHYTELLKNEREDAYPLYEFTCSPLTSFTNPTGGGAHPSRIKGTWYNSFNYGILSISGPENDRKCLIEVKDKKGRLVWNYEIKANDLR